MPRLNKSEAAGSWIQSLPPSASITQPKAELGTASIKKEALQWESAPTGFDAMSKMANNELIDLTQQLEHSREVQRQSEETIANLMSELASSKVKVLESQIKVADAEADKARNNLEQNRLQAVINDQAKLIKELEMENSKLSSGINTHNVYVLFKSALYHFLPCSCQIGKTGF